MGPKSNLTAVLIETEKSRHRDIDTPGRWQCENGSRDWSEAAVKECQELSATTRS